MAKEYVTTDPQTAGQPISDDQPVLGADEAERRSIINTLDSYKQEAENARKTGLNPRDDKWRENLNLYWNRWDFSHKARWQAKESMPEVPQFVDRFASALKEALMSMQGQWYTVTDPKDTERDLAQAVKKMTDLWLSKSGMNMNGTTLGFEAPFEEQMKLGALMMTAATVTWKNDIPCGRVAVEAIDPRNLWYDHTMRNLYRRRRIEIDRHELSDMVGMKDGRGSPIFDLAQTTELVASLEMDAARERKELTGNGVEQTSGRSPIVLDEWIATVVDNTGKKTYDKALFVVANDRYLIRGPEKNPFWHKKDWIVAAPLITVPLSVYGRSYMEDFGSVAKVFNTLTNMILDAVYTSSLKAFAVVPGALLNAGQLAEGITPNKTFLLEDGFDPKQFAQAIELGTLSADAVAVWKSMKEELTEAAQMNEIGLGQFAPKGRTSATEVMNTQQSSSAMVRSMANVVETRHLNPVLDLVWKTGLQHLNAKDTAMQQAVGPEMFSALYARRKELIQRPYTFNANGISVMIARSAALKTLVQVLQIVGSNPFLAQAFMKSADPEKLINLVFLLSNIDPATIEMSARDQMIRSIAAPMGAMSTPPGQGGGAGGDEMSALTSAMGVGNGPAGGGGQ